ncbi:hypothetical protein, partial [Herbaspirillum sp. B65]|uniref:hypothetical protein n=1 Tax=Herbaspirillum sp. B65 TaxID=137708 RepID=UPI001C254894
QTRQTRYKRIKSPAGNLGTDKALTAVLEPRKRCEPGQYREGKSGEVGSQTAIEAQQIVSGAAHAGLTGG